MTCLSQHKDGADLLISYFERTLDPARTLELEAHVAECAECRALVGVWDTLDEWSPATLPQVAVGFDAKLYARIAEEAKPTLWERFWDFAKPALPLAAGRHPGRPPRARRCHPAAARGCRARPPTARR